MYRAVANDLANQLYDLFNIKHDETALFVFLFDLNNKLNDPSLVRSKSRVFNDFMHSRGGSF